LEKKWEYCGTVRQLLIDSEKKWGENIFSNQQSVVRVLGIVLFTTESRPALGLTQPPIQWVPGALSLKIKRLEEVKNAWKYYLYLYLCL
jgi:hypothetical protein